MAHSLLDLPPELLSQVLRSLPVRSLLRFSQTSRMSRVLANSNLHTLSLAIQPIRSRAAEEFCAQKHCVRMPNASTYSYDVLLKFHNALLTSVITRHADTLHTLDLSIWTLTRPVAKAISELCALRDLSIRVEDDLYARAVPRSSMAVEREEQNKGWTLIGQTAVWKRRLQRLKVLNADLTADQLAKLLGGSRWCEEIWLGGCKFIGRDIWTFLGHEWEGRTALQRLHVADCGWPLDKESLEAIGGLSALQHLNIQGCYAMEGDIIEHWNAKVWCIPQLIPPKCVNEQHASAIEVDPEYM
ncbi:hypothetical protein T440DRAFT_382777 [Plenodomus tracheiphilus IPT5]|uniref:F-box domain-containing protein n=1 Tax=Plenodomus tracheiphilus IPT5 TaxID=1408161 RepID=A0A6A7BPX1_9PLEO|nr:hypothetical protein T440DRAFT_382777 [Plenodomus tracheiphilus IPT5]